MALYIRAAVPGDAEAVARLHGEFAAYLRELGDTTDIRFDAAAFRRDGFAPDAAFAALVAETDSEIAGYLFYHFAYDSDRAMRRLYVVDLYVAPRFRRRGAGAALMAAAADACRRGGAEEMFWAVYNANRSAFAFYEGLGASYTTDLTFMSMPVSRQLRQTPSQSE
ncbi:MAG: GNAT family N-acetyltransferase [Candidatus Schekmanbacteria bacterium]|nr:GNAT family N-acetyltransferase [Candidatus Schekmanbacteria bacterium]